jgi:hypothetical protein
MTIHPLLLLLLLSVIPCQLPGLLHRAPQPPGRHTQPYSAILSHTQPYSAILSHSEEPLSAH